jgi:hypothetical protein
MEQMVSLISLGDGSTLSLDFTAMSSLDSRFTFSRSGGGSYTASDGLLYGFDQSTTSNTIGTGSKTFTLSATAGVNRRYAVGDLIIASSGANSMSGSVTSYNPSTQSLVCSMASSSGSGTFTTWIIGNRQPRFDYDPTTLAPRGLLIESSATNLLTYSEDFNAAAWTDTSITRATGNADPAGGTTAVRFTASAGNATVIRSAAIGTSSERTFSVWLRRVTGTGNIQYTQNNGTNWTTQAITSTWTRYSFTHTVDHRVGIRIVTSGDAIEMWGAQLEAGSGAYSYIPTGASTVQRAADICDMTGTNFSSWFVSGSPYSMLFKYSMNNPSAWAGLNVDRGAGLLSASGFVDPRVYVNAAYRVSAISGDIGRYIRVYETGATPDLDMSPGTYPAAASNTALAFAVNTNNSAVYGANQVVGTDSANTLPTGYTQFSIGRTGGALGYINGCIRQIKYWPQRLPNATLQGLVV